MEHPRRAVFMKAGVHDGEAWESIVRRKLNEERDYGVAYWGYRGTVCHPLTQVQPFAGEADDEQVAVFMIPTQSAFSAPWVAAVEESNDRVTWSPIRAGIKTTGDYALLLRSLEVPRDCVDLGLYKVAVGKHAGTPLPEYFRGRVDKACGRLAPSPGRADVRPVALRAELVSPFAVFIRTR